MFSSHAYPGLARSTTLALKTGSHSRSAILRRQRSHRTAPMCRSSASTKTPWSKPLRDSTSPPPPPSSPHRSDRSPSASSAVRFCAAARISRAFSTLVPSSRTTTGTLKPTSRPAFTSASAIRSHLAMPPKMLTSTPFTLRSDKDDAERLDGAFRRDAAADVEEVGRLAAVILDDVHRAHRQAGAVDQAADVAVQADVGQARLARSQLGRVLLVQIAQLLDLRMAEQGVVVERDLGVEGQHRRRCPARPAD